MGSGRTSEITTMIIADSIFNSDPYFKNPTKEVDTLKNLNSVNLFDQNGYHLTEAEQAFLPYNGYATIERRKEDCLRQDWILWDKRDGAHINHSDLFERKGYKEEALQQLELIAKENNPMLYKLARMKPKYGIDISIDFVSQDKVFEVFHYEWDSFEYDLVVDKKQEIEQFVVSQDWDHVASVLWAKRNEWLYLDFFEQTKWRTDYFGLTPEKFKNVIWDS